MNENISKKQFKQAVMPPKGSVVEEKYKVDYVHYGRLSFTSNGNPEIGTMLVWEGRKYMVDYQPKPGKFSATFAGFVENPTIGASDVEDITCDCGECGDDTTVVDITNEGNNLQSNE